MLSQNWSPISATLANIVFSFDDVNAWLTTARIRLQLSSLAKTIPESNTSPKQ